MHRLQNMMNMRHISEIKTALLKGVHIISCPISASAVQPVLGYVLLIVLKARLKSCIL